MSGRIIGIGLASPRHSIDQSGSLAFAKEMLFPPNQRGRGLDAIYRRSTVQRRGSVLLEQTSPSQPSAADASSDASADSPVDPSDPRAQNFYPVADSQEERGPTTGERILRFGEEAMPLAHEASAAALREAGIDAASITHLVVVTCTGFQSPGVDVGLIRSLGLSPETERVQVGFMGCHAAINGLRVASGWVSQDPAARVLVVCVELCTLHYQYGWETDHLVSNAIFADGAAAVVLVSESDPVSANSSAEASRSEQTGETPRLVATGSRLIADSAEAMTWHIGDHGFRMTLSAEVPDRIRAELPGFLESWLQRHGLRVADIGGWAIHPGGPRILSSAQEALGLDDELLVEARGVLQDHGNMSSPTMLFILERLARSGRPRPWLMLGFGPGLEVEVALLR